MTSAELLFACIRRSVFGLEMQADEIAAINEQSLKELYVLAARHDLAHLVYDALQKSDLLPEGEAGQKFRYQKDLAVYRYIHQSAALEDICRVFEKAKIVYVPLKGAVIRDFYPEPWMRTSCDIDILVHEEDLERAVAVLEREMDFHQGTGKRLHDIKLHGPNKVNLELHFRLEMGCSGADGVLARVWEYITPIENNMYRHKMSDEILVFYHLVHMSSHFMNGGCGLKPFLDIAFLRKSISVDHTKLDVLLEKGRLKKFANAIIPLSESICSEGNINKISEGAKLILDYVLSGGVYGTMDNSICSHQARQGGTLKNIIHRIWIPYSELVYSHVAPPDRECLKPFYEIKRWVLGAFNKERRNNWALQIKKNIAVSDNERCQIKQMLADLDLLDPTL